MIIQNVITLFKGKRYKSYSISCPEIWKERARVGFKMVDSLTGKSEVLSNNGWILGSSVGKYRVNLQHLPQVGLVTPNNVVDEVDVIIIDEIEPMEL